MAAGQVAGPGAGRGAGRATSRVVRRGAGHVGRPARRLGVAAIGVVLVGALLPAAVLAATGPVYTTQPAGARYGQPFATQPIVAIRKGANTDPSAGGSITFSIRGGTGTTGAVLTCAGSGTGGRTFAVVRGVATAAGCSITLAGSGYVLTATWTGGGSDDSAAFAVSSGSVATKVGFATQPARGTPGGALAAQPVVTIQDATGATIADSTAPVTLSLGANPGAGALTCTGGLMKAAVAGVATFAGCAISTVGVGYTLTAGSPGLTSASSTSFDVSDRLAFVIQPAGASPGVAFVTQPVVAVRAGAANTAIHDAATQVTLAIKAGTGATGAVLTCAGGLARAVVAGLAAFSGCRIDRASPTAPANPYQLVATATNLASATSTALTVGVAPTITLTSTASVIHWAAQIVLVTQFGTGGANRIFELQGARDGVTWTTIARVATDASGRFAMYYTPVTNLYYRVVFAGSADLPAATSATIRVVVRQLAILRPLNNVLVKPVARGTTVTFTTTVRPSRPELVPATVTYWIYRKVAGVWTPYATRFVTADSLGLARLPWTFSSTGSWYVRSMANPTPWNANSVKSPVLQYRVY